MTSKRFIQPTIISTWIPVVLHTYESYGYDPGELLDLAGIDKQAILDPEARIPISDYDTLWRLAVSKTKDDAIGLNVLPFLKPTTFHALGYTLLAGATIAESLDRLCRYYKIISDEVNVTVVTEERMTALCFTPFKDGPLPVGASVDAFMAVSITYARTLDNQLLNPAKVQFMHEQPDVIDRFKDVFKAPIFFSSDDNRIYFLNEDVARPLPAANAEIALRNDQIAADYLVRFEKIEIEHQVRSRIIESLSAGEPTLETTARSMGMSSRSLNRHLHNRNTSYRRILHEVRKELAGRYLKQNDLSVLDIAFRLGYADSSNFSRAFKQWYGVSPSRYRDPGPDNT